MRASLPIRGYEVLTASSGEETLNDLNNQLRRKIETDASHPRYLLTEPWVGYRFVPNE